MNTATIPAPSEAAAAKLSWSAPVLTVLSVASETAAVTHAGADGGMTTMGDLGSSVT